MWLAVFLGSIPLDLYYPGPMKGVCVEVMKEQSRSSTLKAIFN